MHDIPIIRTRRRTLALMVSVEGAVVVRAPMRMAERAIHAFIAQHHAWIQKAQERMQHQHRHTPKKTYTEGERFLYLGQHYTLTAHHSPAVTLHATALHIPHTSIPTAQKTLTAWYKKQAEDILDARVAHYARSMQLYPAGIRIGSARSRWGSCGIGNMLNFTWRLIMAPLPVIDYVVVHELAHIAHKNHGTKFWALVAAHIPDAHTHQKWLRTHGAEMLA